MSYPGPKYNEEYIYVYTIHDNTKTNVQKSEKNIHIYT